MTEIEVKKVSTGTVYKLFAIGLSVGFVPLFLFFGVFGAMGYEVLTWNEQPVTGIKAIFLSPFMGVFMALMFTGMLGTVCVFGLWLFSLFRPMSVSLVQKES